MDHVAIDLGGRESQICIRRPNNDVHLERRIPTAKLKAFFKTYCRVRRPALTPIGSSGSVRA